MVKEKLVTVKDPVKKHAGGRPTKYKKKYCKEIIEFFSRERTKIILETYYYKNGETKEKEIEVANELPTIIGFCIKIGVDRTTLLEWVSKHPEFSHAYKKAKEMQEEFWLQNSVRGLFPGAFTIFAGKNMFGWKDRTETDVTSGGKPIPILGGISVKDVHSNDSDKENSEAPQKN